ncbi:maltose transport inner membrane protein [Salmonella enterica subsp. enterica serovar Heidelberg]|nr:maltose transport inner membrane protein [Salmonella enterica subsp. enterica serovar Heidelberg]
MFPLLMVIAISLREGNFATGSLIPDKISWEHWRLALGFSVEHADGRVTPPPFPVLLWLWNSVKIAGITAIGIVALSTTCAYAFARMRFPGKATLLKGMLIFQMFPAVLSLVALYALFDRLGQYIPFIGLNTHGGVIFAYLGGIALHVWTIKGYFETIDSSLEEAAALDGATPWQAFRLVLLPLSVPILAVVFILSFIAAITEVPVASLLLRDVDSYTLAVGMQQYLNPQNYLWGRLCRRRRPFSYSYHPGVPVGATLAGQRPDGRGCERLSFIEVPARQRAMPLPSSYVIPTYGRILALFGALFFMRYRQRLIYCHAIRPLRCGDAYSRRSRFELHNHNVITNRRIAAE